VKRALTRLRDLFVRPGSTAGLIVMALVVGAGVGIATVLLVEGIDLVGDGTRELAEALPADWMWMFITVPAGLLLAWWLAHRLGPETAGDGVPEVMAALTVRGGEVRSRVIWLKTIVTSITLGSGGSAGREGPIVHIGGAIGSAVGRVVNLGEDQIRSLVAAGAGAGIGASFNAPIAGMLFAMEVVLGGFAIRHLNAVVVSSVTAAVVSRSLIGEELTFPIAKYPLADPRELLLYGALGILAVVVGWGFLRTLGYFEGIGSTSPSVRARWAVGFGLLVAAAGFASVLLTDDAEFLDPPVLGTGQDFVGSLLSGTSFVWWILLGLIVLKIIATSATLGSRASGGAFAPSLFMGAALGAGFVALLDPVWGFSELRSGAFALVGMSAVFAAVARAPLTSIIIVFEITQDYGLVLPLMLATTLATLLTERFHRDSVYTMALRKMGVRLTRRSDVDIFDTVMVSEAMSPVAQVIDPGMTTAEVQGHLDHIRHHGLAVVEDEELVGIITVTDILRAGGASDQITARDAMTPDPTTVTPRTPVSLALERMAALGVGRLPVVNDADPLELVGMFRREDAVGAYHRALESERETEARHERLKVRLQPGTEFFEFDIEERSIADGRLVSEVAWPEGLTLVSIRRDRGQLVPAGGTMLKAGDIVTAFGTSTAHDRVLIRLDPGAAIHEDDVGA
jgi:CIC family chloride channel protein